MLTFREYEDQSTEGRIVNYPGRFSFQGVVYCALALAGETGELANKVKKMWRDHDGKIPIDKFHELVEEAGDSLWYLTQFLVELDNLRRSRPPTTLESTAKENIRKLKQRYSTEGKER